MRKKHEADGFDVFVEPEEAFLMAKAGAPDSKRLSKRQDLHRIRGYHIYMYIYKLFYSLMWNFIYL